MKMYGICFVLMQVIAIAMDVFTDVDIFKEVVDASIRGVPVYIILDHTHFKSFFNMTANLDIQIQKLRVSNLSIFIVHLYLSYLIINSCEIFIQWSQSYVSICFTQNIIRFLI